MKHDSVNGAILTTDELRILSWSADSTVRLWDTATGQQIGPAMKHGGSVNGAVLTTDERRILSWSNDRTLRLWDAAWPRGNLLEIACALLSYPDLTAASRRYGVKIEDAICKPRQAIPKPDWSLIEPAPTD